MSSSLSADCIHPFFPVASCVVTREKISAIVAHAGHKWQSPKWVPGAWGYSWATQPRGLTNTVNWPSRLGVG
jgi:hypothetical protein